MADRLTKEDEALLGELGVELKDRADQKFTPQQERVIAGFEEIQRFVEEHGRAPQHGDERDIFERLYAVRLDRIRLLPDCRELLAPFDNDGLMGDSTPTDEHNLTDIELLAELDVEVDSGSDITKLRHVRPTFERKQPKDVAHRTKCEDFGTFKPMFERVQAELDARSRQTVPYKQNPDNDADVRQGDLFIIDGQKVYVADLGEEFKTDYDRDNRRLRVVFDNGTESGLLLRSLQRSLYKDEASRRILSGDRKQALFSDLPEPDDVDTGHLYVLRSLSDNPFIAEHRDAIHKIGVTGGDIKRRVANARKDPTFLLSEVEVVESYSLANINRTKLENLVHQFFSTARLDVKLRDRFGENVEPREWFLVPLPEIRRAIELIRDGSINGYRYDANTATIVSDTGGEDR